MPPSPSAPGSESAAGASCVRVRNPAAGVRSDAPFHPPYGRNSSADLRGRMAPMPVLTPARILLFSWSLVASSAFAQPAPTDEAAIRAVRARNNAAIAAHDVTAMADAWLPHYVGVTSRNARDVDRDAARDSYAELI